MGLGASQFSKEIASVVGLQEAMTRTLLRLVMIFEGIEAITNSGIENPFIELANGSTDMVKVWRNQIALTDNADEIFAFIESHRLDISWERKGE